MKELHEGAKGRHFSHRRKFEMQGTSGPQCIKMLVISAYYVMHVNAL
jgi:hypothetical protein